MVADSEWRNFLKTENGHIYIYIYIHVPVVIVVAVAVIEKVPRSAHCTRYALKCSTAEDAEAQHTEGALSPRGVLSLSPISRILAGSLAGPNIAKCNTAKCNTAKCNTAEDRRGEQDTAGVYVVCVFSTPPSCRSCASDFAQYPHICFNHIVTYLHTSSPK